MGEGASAVLGSLDIGFLLAEELDVAAQGHRGDEVFGFADVAPDELGAEAEGELEDLDADPARGQEVTELVEGDQDAEHDQEPPSLLDQQPQRVRRDGEFG